MRHTVRQARLTVSVQRCSHKTDSRPFRWWFKPDISRLCIWIIGTFLLWMDFVDNFSYCCCFCAAIFIYIHNKYVFCIYDEESMQINYEWRWRQITEHKQGVLKSQCKTKVACNQNIGLWNAFSIAENLYFVAFFCNKWKMFGTNVENFIASNYAVVHHVALSPATMRGATILLSKDQRAIYLHTLFTYVGNILTPPSKCWSYEFTG